MIIINRDNLIDLFNKCGDLAQYHMEAGIICRICKSDEAMYHLNMADKYIDVRDDILVLLAEED